MKKCRTCGAEKKEGVVWYDDIYCSGKCKADDGGKIEEAADYIRASGVKASLEDYMMDYPKNIGGKDARGQRIKGRMPKRYRRRYEANRLNWGEPLDTKQLKQAGFRANRTPLPGDFDYVEEIEENQNG